MARSPRVDLIPIVVHEKRRIGGLSGCIYSAKFGELGFSS